MFDIVVVAVLLVGDEAGVAVTGSESTGTMGGDEVVGVVAVCDVAEDEAEGFTANRMARVRFPANADSIHKYVR